MNALSTGFDHSVKSVTLAEYTNPPLPDRPSFISRLNVRPPAIVRPAFFGRVAMYVRLGLIAWGAISFGALAGIAAYYINDAATDGPLLVGAAVSHDTPDEPFAPSPPRDRLAALVDDPATSVVMAPPSGLAQALALRAPAVAEARMPRPRPEPPIITGSIGRSTAPPYYVRRRGGFDPCEALRSIGAPFLFGNRCGRHARVYMPPPPRYYQAAPTSAPYHQPVPAPYQPPVIVQN